METNDYRLNEYIPQGKKQRIGMRNNKRERDKKKNLIFKYHQGEFVNHQYVLRKPRRMREREIIR